MKNLLGKAGVGNITSFLLGNWKAIGAILASFAILGTLLLWHEGEVKDAFNSGRAEAVAECNSTQLEEELRAEQARAELLKTRNENLARELADQRDEVRERVVIEQEIVEVVREVAVEVQGTCAEEVSPTTTEAYLALQERFPE